MMVRQRLALFVYSAIVFGAGIAAGELWSGPAAASAQAAPRVFELRTYTAPDGKLPDLHRRFRDHTLRLFAKHGMTNVVYLSPQEAPLSSNTIVYLLAHQSREAAKQSWSAFANDPEWKKVASESEANGKILANVQRMFLDPTDYSPMK
jgi:hypothetical protein